MAVEVTGYQLKEALKRYNLKLNALQSQFTPSLKKFPSENKPTPTVISEQIGLCEDAIARIQAAQAFYNLQVEIDVGGKKLTLCEAVKRVGGAGRIEKMWREASAVRIDRYAYAEETREEGKVYAEATITAEQALEQAQKASTAASEMRAAIAEANSKRVSVPLLDERILRG